MIKVAAPTMALQRDRSRDPGARRRAASRRTIPLAYASACARTLRVVDGLDEVHLEAIAKQEVTRSNWYKLGGGR